MCAALCTASQLGERFTESECLAKSISAPVCPCSQLPRPLPRSRAPGVGAPLPHADWGLGGSTGAPLGSDATRMRSHPLPPGPSADERRERTEMHAAREGRAWRGGAGLHNRERGWPPSAGPGAGAGRAGGRAGGAPAGKGTPPPQALERPGLRRLPCCLLPGRGSGDKSAGWGVAEANVLSKRV